MKKIVNSYLETKNDLETIIKELEISNENKNTLLKFNEELCNYANLLDSGKITFRVSYFMKSVNLPIKYEDIIFRTIKKMFKKYSLCLGDSKKIGSDDLSDFFREFDENDFWWIDCYGWNNTSSFLRFLEDAKRICNDSVKCVFISMSDSLSNYDMSDNIASLKHNFDYEFIYSQNDMLKDLKSKLLDGGIDVQLNESQFDYSEYKNNESYINTQLVKNSIRRNDSIVDYSEIINQNNNSKTRTLEELVGLENVKEKMEQLRKYLEFSKKININQEIFLNTIFKGNAGTGKTTVAKIYTKMLYDLGYIKNNKMIEIVPSDFMAHYVGQTQDKTREILDKAKGGVLFIDEAYNLNMAKEYSGGTYMREAVIELLKYMEDKKNVVIFSGYKLEMEELLNLNPGFRSRIGEIILFKDYSLEQLIEIFDNNIKKYNLSIDKDSKNKLAEIIKKKMNSKNFGNARYIEKLVNKVMIKHAENIYGKENDIYILKPEDFNIKDDDEKESFGF